MSYRSKIINARFSTKFDLLSSALRDLGGVLDSPSGDGFLWRLTVGDKSAIFFGETFPFNNAAAWRLAKDKLATYQALETHNVPIPKGIAYFRPNRYVGSNQVEELRLLSSLKEQMAEVFQDHLKDPGKLFVIKPGEASGGAGVRICKSRQEVLDNAAQAFQWGHYGLVQDYIPGSEWRVVILRGEVVLTYERQQNDGSEDLDFSRGAHNLSQGARPFIHEKTPEIIIQTAKRAHDVVGLTFSGTDLKLTPDGKAVVIEVNGNPGFLIFRQYYPDHAEKLVRLIAKELVQFVLEFGN